MENNETETTWPHFLFYKLENNYCAENILGVTEHYCAENNCAGDCAVFEKLRWRNFSKTAQSPAQLISAQ